MNLNLHDPRDWMKNLPGDLSVTQMSIPGTHNSHAIESNVVVASNGNVNFAAYALYNPGIVSMYAQVYTAIATCQRSSMWDQLHFGVRCFDLRVRSWEKFDNEGGRWAFGLCHGSAKLKESLTQVLDGMADFLKKYPSETLLISIKWDEEKRDGSNPPVIVTPDRNLRFGVSEIWDKHNWFKGAYWPKLHEVRGRAILLRRFWNPDNELLGINFDDPSFYNNACSKGPEGKWKQTTHAGRDSMTIEERWKCARDMLNEAKETDFNDNVMYFASTCDVWLDMDGKKPRFWAPSYYAEQLCQPLLTFMNGEYRSQKKGRYGVVVTDFCNQTISQLIFEQNFSR